MGFRLEAAHVHGHAGARSLDAVRVLVGIGLYAGEDGPRGLLVDIDLGIALHQSLAEGAHADDASARKGGDGTHVTAVLEYLGETLVHLARDALMLVPAHAGELAHAVNELGIEGLVLVVELLALGVQQAFLVRLGHDGIELQIE